GMTNPIDDGLHVRFDGVRMAFGRRPVFESLTCAFPRGKISVILGGSGSGKSTILRLIGGLISPQSGRIVVDGEDVTRLSERRLYDVRRKIGMMFQAGALLDSLTVFENLAFPLREHTRLGAPEIAAEVHDRLEAVGLSNVDELLPGQLSGGMAKRVALARAIVRRPSLLLCDEPFSGLDPASTKRIEALLRKINEDYDVTVIVVSHHIPSTVRMADRMLMLLPWGVVEGTPAELMRSQDRRIIDFLSEEVAPAPETLAEASGAGARARSR
ncbi:MAG: ABC transporter ATP-binding protein, partial [Candidatus Binatia bacterium]